MSWWIIINGAKLVRCQIGLFLLPFSNSHLCKENAPPSNCGTPTWTNRWMNAIQCPRADWANGGFPFGHCNHCCVCWGSGCRGCAHFITVRLLMMKGIVGSEWGRMHNGGWGRWSWWRLNGFFDEWILSKWLIEKYH